jgi:DNA primase
VASYSQDILDEIRARTDIVDLVGRFVSLKKAGVNWKGLCPFHGEKTPSFMVNPKKGIFHCFGCGVGGDAFGFLMRQDKLSFPEAVRALAKSAGVTLPEERERDPGASGREELLRIMELAARFYADHLWKSGGERARQYLEGRGIDPDVARRFGLGYAPDSWDALLTFLHGEKIADDAIVAAGLTLPRQSGTGFYDRFRGRLLFTIRDIQGRVVAFGGRAFGDETPKYLNSPETPLYSKGNLLYSVDIARDAMRQKDRALLVEGYVDCLMAHQYGFTETVAALGTSFTAAQLALLRRHCSEVVTFFDADAAGQKAAERAETLLEPSGGGAAWAVNRSGNFDTAGFRMKVAVLPAGHDPDTFLRAEGGPAFEKRIATARSLLAYALDRAIANPDGRTGPGARATAFARAAMMLAKVADAQEADALAREAATKLGVDPTQLWIEAQRLSRAMSRPVTPAMPPTTSRAPVPERDLIVLLLHSPDARPELLPLLDEIDVQHGDLRAIVAALKRRPDAGGEALMTDLPDDAARGTLAALLVEERDLGDVRPTIDQYKARLMRQQRLRRMRQVSREIAETQATTGAGAPLEDALRSLSEDGKEVHSHALGQSHYGTEPSPRSSRE